LRNSIFLNTQKHIKIKIIKILDVVQRFRGSDATARILQGL
jgi:hypothetical protein